MSLLDFDDFGGAVAEIGRVLRPRGQLCLAMTFSSVHRPLSAYAAALTGQGLALTALTEHGDGMIPWLLAMRAEKIQR